MPQGPIVATTELARTYYFLGDYDKAIRTYAKYVQTRPDAAPQIREELAFCYYRTNLRGEAQAEYERALTGYEAQIASGQNVDDASHGARTCMAALRALEAR
jgi:tetratricopeptide (TPR) repeat protein